MEYTVKQFGLEEANAYSFEENGRTYYAQPGWAVIDKHGNNVHRDGPTGLHRFEVFALKGSAEKQAHWLNTNA